MFTPPKKIFSGWSPRTDPTRKSGSGGDVSKGKDVVFDEDGLMGRVENTGENMGLKARLMKLETEVWTILLVSICVCIYVFVFVEVYVIWTMCSCLILTGSYDFIYA